MSSPTQDDPRPCVLVVDDDEIDREAVKRLLKDGYQVLQAEDGASGMRMIESHSIDCLLLDYLLPDTDGVSFVLKLRTSEGALRLPIVMLTGQGDERVAVDALQAGASDYIPKRALTRSAVLRAVENAIEKAELQSRVEQYRAELEAKNAELAVSNEELQRRNEEIKGFYQQLSHELKTPLTSNQAFLSLVLDGTAGELSKDQEAYLGYALQACKQMTHCVNDILDVSRLNTGKMDFQPEQGDLAELIEKTLTSLLPSAKEIGVQLTWNSAKDMPPASMHGKRIVQVLNNLVGNALKFTPEGGEVHVEAALGDDPDTLVVSVADTGKGIESDSLAHIFERLYQVSTGNTGFFPGLGLGLHISREIVRMHGGEISVTSSPGRGSTFSFTLQVHDAATRHVTS